MSSDCNEAQAYRALMEDPLSEVVPKFYREFKQNDDGKSTSSDLSFFSPSLAPGTKK